MPNKSGIQGVPQCKPKPKSFNLLQEREVLQLFWDEHPAKEIGEILCISQSTVEAHRWNICCKLGAENSISMVKRALLAGLLKL